MRNWWLETAHEKSVNDRNTYRSQTATLTRKQNYWLFARAMWNLMKHCPSQRWTLHTWQPLTVWTLQFFGVRRCSSLHCTQSALVPILEMTWVMGLAAVTPACDTACGGCLVWATCPFDRLRKTSMRKSRWYCLRLEPEAPAFSVSLKTMNALTIAVCSSHQHTYLHHLTEERPTG